MTVEERRAIEARMKAIEGEMQALREERIGLRKKVMESVTGPALQRLNARLQRRYAESDARRVRAANREANPVPFNELAEDRAEQRGESA